MLGYGVKEFIHHYGLCDEVIGTKIIGLYNILVGVERRQNYYFHILPRGILPYGLYHLKAVHKGHEDIKEEKIRLGLIEFLHALQPVFALVHIEIEVAKHLFHKNTVQGNIVYDKDAELGKILITVHSACPSLPATP